MTEKCQKDAGADGPFIQFTGRNGQPKHEYKELKEGA